MLVLNGARDDMPEPQRLVIDWLHTWTGPYLIPGVAISNYSLPEGPATDLLVITPNACIAIAVEGMLLKESGTLRCPAEERWQLTGFDGDPVRVPAGDPNPLPRVRAAMDSLAQHLASAADIDTNVTGLVLVLPQVGTAVTADPGGPLPAGIEVLAGELRELRGWFRTTARREIAWTAEQVRAALAALHFADAVTVAQLAAEGFRSAEADRPPAPTHTPPVTPGPPPTLPGPADAPPPAEPVPAPLSTTGAARAKRPVDKPKSAKTGSAKPRANRGPLLLAIGAVVAVLILGGAIWLFAQSGSTVGPPDTGNHSVTEPPPQLPIEVPPPTTEPTTEAPSPRTPQGCFPFQPDC
ncbi:hypothetical protein [Nocardia brasiliensis]|uniref:hypothetical protein n=1 Tax=Nocardia brasiliensis TaxID=37326 RepID=UPI003D90FA4D